MNIFRRRKFFIHKKFQTKLLAISFSYIIFFVGVTGSSLFIPLIVEMVKANGPSETALQSARQILYLHDTFWPAVFLTVIIIGLHSLYTSHKIAGPFYRLKLTFEAMKEGFLPKTISPRKNDYLLTEIELFNQALENFREKIREIQENRTQLNRAIVECREMVVQGSKDEIMERIKDLAEKEGRLGDLLDYFKISS